MIYSTEFTGYQAKERAAFCSTCHTPIPRGETTECDSCYELSLRASLGIMKQNTEIRTTECPPDFDYRKVTNDPNHIPAVVSTVAKQLELRTKVKDHAKKPMPNRWSNRLEELKSMEVGRKYQYWTITDIFQSEEDKYREYYAVAQCICGKVRNVRIGNLKRGTTRSCGCKNERRPGRVPKGSVSTAESRYLGRTIQDHLVTNVLPGTAVPKKAPTLVGMCIHCRKENRRYARAGVLKGVWPCDCQLVVPEVRAKRTRVPDPEPGTLFGLWEVLGLERFPGKPHMGIRCRCACGSGIERVIRKEVLLVGRSKSCGCDVNSRVAKTRVENHRKAVIGKIIGDFEITDIEGCSKAGGTRHTRYFGKCTKCGVEANKVHHLWFKAGYWPCKACAK